MTPKTRTPTPVGLETRAASPSGVRLHVAAASGHLPVRKAPRDATLHAQRLGFRMAGQDPPRPPKKKNPPRRCDEAIQTVSLPIRLHTYQVRTSDPICVRWKSCLPGRGSPSALDAVYHIATQTDPRARLLFGLTLFCSAGPFSDPFQTFFRLGGNHATQQESGPMANLPRGRIQHLISWEANHVCTIKCLPVLCSVHYTTVYVGGLTPPCCPARSHDSACHLYLQSRFLFSVINKTHLRTVLGNKHE